MDSALHRICRRPRLLLPCAQKGCTMTRWIAGSLLLTLTLTLAGPTAPAAPHPTLAQQNEILLRELQAEHHLSDEQMQRIRAIFARSGFIGQGNPTIARHPMTPDQCRQVRQNAPRRIDETGF